MANKGMFSQGLAVLLSSSPTLEELENLLTGFGQLSRKPASESWEISGPAVVVPYRPEVNGYVNVDLVEHSWPDDMGHPKEKPLLFASWSMGHFGPCSFPGNLARAIEQAWAWPAAKDVVPNHKAFIRVRSSYLFGAGPEIKCLPQDYAAFPELQFLTGIVQALMKHPRALSYFNPNGEVLKNAKDLDDALAFSKSHSLPPLEVWSNVRLFNLDDGWLMMDTIGMHQLDLPDHEACFRKGAFHPNDVANFLRNASLYLLNQGEIVKDGNTMDGPGKCRWQAKSFEKPLSPAPRRVLRWLPSDGYKPPQRLTE
jgi:hypothetical protein